MIQKDPLQSIRARTQFGQQRGGYGVESVVGGGKDRDRNGERPAEERQLA
jgi:hypothetical protein